MLIFTLIIFILLILLKGLIPTVKWTFIHPWVLSEFNVTNFPTTYLVSFQFTSKAVCWDSSQPRQRFSIHPNYRNQDKSFLSVSTQSANPFQTRHDYANIENRHPIQPISSPLQKLMQTPPLLHQMKSQNDHSPSNQSAPGSVVPYLCSLLFFCNIPLPTFHLLKNTPYCLPITPGVFQPNYQTAQPTDCCLTPYKLNLASNRPVIVRLSTAQVFLPFTRLFESSYSFRWSRSSKDGLKAETLHSSPVQ